MKIKKALRLMALVFMIFLACIVPFPMKLTRKDNLPKDLIEYVELKENEEDDDELKAIF
ncbi:hypothetical protein [Psychroserpens sp.]|uniref:hypothetical protein n=1 Tax=Psychroserpens sp. TaxID=2020870 RepID=UPI002B278ACC|nr:hypothetical protein [Psychroserpens sp.]